MSDIYKISNRNRLRNKEKKKLREAIVPTQEAAEDGNESAPEEEKPQFDYFEGRSKRHKDESDDAAHESTAEFLAEIGWVSDPASVLANRELSSIGHFSENTTARTANPYLMNERI
jgi:hypothetical protein